MLLTASLARSCARPLGGAPLRYLSAYRGSPLGALGEPCHCRHSAAALAPHHRRWAASSTTVTSLQEAVSAVVTPVAAEGSSSSSSSHSASNAGTPGRAGGAGGGAATSPRSSLLGIYGELAKARLSSLVVMTTGAGYLMAGAPESWVSLTSALLGTSLAAAAAATFNQLIEIRSDGRMMRTQGRPLPAARISAPHALAFGCGLTATSIATLALGANPLTAALGAANIALYTLVYTPLKTRTTLNTAVGAVVGAVPPMMGWAAATGSLLAPEPLLLGATLFLWQFPHFYALGWTLRKDYLRGGYAMTPCFDATGKTTAWCSLRAALALATLPFLSTALGVTGPMFAVEGLVLNGYFLALAARFYATPNDATARSLFRASLLYLPLLLIFAVFHSLQWRNSEAAERAALEGHAPWLAALRSDHASQGPSGAAEGEPAPRGRPTDWFGGAVEGLVLAGRAAGRMMCMHETFIESQVATRAATVRAMARICGADAGAPAGGSAGGLFFGLSSDGGDPQGSDGTPSAAAAADAPLTDLADITARAATRDRCPVVLMEAAGSEAAEAAASGSATVQGGLEKGAAGVATAVVAAAAAAAGGPVVPR